MFWVFVGMRRHLTVATSLVAEHRLQVLKLQQVRLAGPGHRLQLPRARRLFLDQGSNPCPLRSQADSCLLKKEFVQFSEILRTVVTTVLHVEPCKCF